MSVKFDNNIIARIQQATSIVDVIGEHLSLERKGKEFAGVCPFHDDHRPSMYVNPVKQIFKCFACGAGGDAFKFIQLRENLSFPQAVERLADRAGIQLERVSRPKRAGVDGDEAVDPKAVSRANAWAHKYWQQNLDDESKGAAGREYINGRQISPESAKLWGLGLALDSWDGLVSAAKESKVPESLLVSSGLVVSRDNGGFYDKFRDRLMFPIVDVTGRVIGFGGRTLGDDPAKYMNSPATALFDKSNCVYGLDQGRHEIVSSGTAVVVEGYTDVIMCHQFGCRNVVATLGTSFTEGHARLLRRYAKRIVLVFDSDVAGMEAANRGLDVCLSQHIDIKLAFVGEGKDPCDYLLSAGREAFEAVVAGASDVLEFKWQRLIDGLAGSDNVTDRRVVTEEYLQMVVKGMQGGKIDPITRGAIVNKLSGIVGLSPDEIRREIGRFYGRMGRNSSVAVRNQMVTSFSNDSVFGKAQRELLEVLLNEPRYFEKVSKKIGSDVFDVAVLREIAEAFFGLAEEGNSVDLSSVLRRIESVEAGAAAVELAEVGEAKGNYGARLAESLGFIEGHFAELAKNKMKADLRDNETESLRKIDEVLRRKNKRSPGIVIR